MLSRTWVSPIVVSLLCLLFVVPVGAQDGGNLLDDPGFDNVNGSGWAWTVGLGSAEGSLTGPSGPDAPHLRQHNGLEMTVSQCVNTTGFVEDYVYVGGLIGANPEGYGAIVVTRYAKTEDCSSEEQVGDPEIMVTNSSDWVSVFTEVEIPKEQDPDEWGTSVRITMWAQEVDLLDRPYFDDAFVQTSEPTSVAVMTLVARDRVVPIVLAAATVVMGAWMVVRRRRSG